MFSYIICLIGNISFVMIWLQAFEIIDITPSNHRIGNFALSSISFFSYLLLTIRGFFVNGTSYLDDGELMFIISIFIGIYWICSIYALKESKNVTLERTTIKLRNDEFEIIKQSPVVFGDIVLPIGQDFPYINTYLKCKNGNIILLPRNYISEKHNIECDIIPIEKYGLNVYECVSLHICDNIKHKNEVIKKIITKWLIIQSIIGSIILVPILAYPTAPYTGGNLIMDIIYKIGSFVLMEIFGAIFTKIEKVIFKVFGYYIMLSSIVNLVEIIGLFI